MKLILIRHGQSQWNLENRFTGWKDVSLTEKGIEEAAFAGKQLLKMDIDINSVHTSILSRAIETTKIIVDTVKFSYADIQYDWRLNERHYGALQGLNKSETASKYGEKQVQIWRRSYNTAPPLLRGDDKRHPKFNPKFKKIKGPLPAGESLENVVKRLRPFWENYFIKIKENLGNHIIVAHSNSLRAIVKILDRMSDKEIVSINIPTGVPLVYSFDDSFNIVDKKYLIDSDELKKKQEVIANQGKAK